LVSENVLTVWKCQKWFYWLGVSFSTIRARWCLRLKNINVDAVFYDVPTFVPQIWEYGNFSVWQNYGHFVAQETSTIGNWFILSFFFIKKVEIDNAKVVFLVYFDRRFRPFLMKNLKNLMKINYFLIMLVLVIKVVLWKNGLIIRASLYDFTNVILNPRKFFNRRERPIFELFKSKIGVIFQIIFPHFEAHKTI